MANVYSIANLLVGTEYFSRSIRGKIVSAKPHPKDVWYDGCESYLVEIRPQYGLKNAYRTVAVRKEN